MSPFLVFMMVKVLFFGATAETVGKREITIDLPVETTADDAFARIIAANPDLKRHKLLFAVNETYADADKIIGDGDELAVFTAVSGG